jgi:hypothetical protein
MQRVRILVLFYRNFWIPSLLISVVGCVLVEQSHSLSYAMLVSIVKVITNVLIGTLFHIFKQDQLYFYNNLGFSTSFIYTLALMLDMILWFDAIMLMATL